MFSQSRKDLMSEDVLIVGRRSLVRRCMFSQSGRSFVTEGVCFHSREEVSCRNVYVFAVGWMSLVGRCVFTVGRRSRVGRFVFHNREELSRVGKCMFSHSGGGLVSDVVCFHRGLAS